MGFRENLWGFLGFLSENSPTAATAADSARRRGVVVLDHLCYNYYMSTHNYKTISDAEARRRIERDKAFGFAASRAARRALYPILFPDASLEFTEQLSTYVNHPCRQALDYWLGIDIVVTARTAHLPFPVQFTVQERFRRPSPWRFVDVTLTAFNQNTGGPSEAFTSHAAFLLYAYYNPETGQFPAATWINLPALKEGLAAGKIRTGEHVNPKGHLFYSYPLADLRACGALLWVRGEGKPTA